VNSLILEKLSLLAMIPDRFRDTHNCLHIPHGEAGGLISVATAIALNFRWPATYVNIMVSQLATQAT
jgi:hypothetical protein